MTHLDAIYAHIAAHEEVFIQRLMDYVRNPSISAHGVGIGETAEWLTTYLRSLGFDTTAYPTAGWPMIVGRHHHKPGKPTVLFYGHYDVQPADPLHLWQSAAFEPEIRGNRLYGRGAADNKGPLMVHIAAVGRLLERRPDLPLRCRIRLGRRFAPPSNIQAFATELDNYFSSEFGRDFPVFVHIHLGHLEFALVGHRYFVQNRGNHFAGATPFGPIVHQNRLSAVQDLVLKSGVGDVFDEFAGHEKIPLEVVDTAYMKSIVTETTPSVRVRAL